MLRPTSVVPSHHNEQYSSEYKPRIRKNGEKRLVSDITKRRNSLNEAYYASQSQYYPYSPD